MIFATTLTTPFAPTDIIGVVRESSPLRTVIPHSESIWLTWSRLPEASFIEDLGADSLDAIELIMEIESQFDVEIADNEATKIKLVSDIVNFLESQGK